MGGGPPHLPHFPLTTSPFLEPMPLCTGVLSCDFVLANTVSIDRSSPFPTAPPPSIRSTVAVLFFRKTAPNDGRGLLGALWDPPLPPLLPPPVFCFPSESSSSAGNFNERLPPGPAAARGTSAGNGSPSFRLFMRRRDLLPDPTVSSLGVIVRLGREEGCISLPEANSASLGDPSLPGANDCAFADASPPHMFPMAQGARSLARTRCRNVVWCRSYCQL